MKGHFSLVCIALLLGCGMPLVAQVSKHPSAGSQLDKARLEEVVEAWVTLDASRAARLYATDDPDLVIYDIAPLKYTGWAEVEKGAVKVFQPIQSMTQKLSDDVKIHNSGKTAWATATLIIYLLKKDGSREQIHARWTTIWEKRGTGWIIVVHSAATSDRRSPTEEVTVAKTAKAPPCRKNPRTKSSSAAEAERLGDCASPICGPTWFGPLALDRAGKSPMRERGWPEPRPPTASQSNRVIKRPGSGKR